MFRFKMHISYDGTGYSGWQKQKGSLSIQEVLEDALSTAVRKKTFLYASGRTDKGVHAEGQVAHFDLNISDINLTKLNRSLNGILPNNIVVCSVNKSCKDFHACFSAKSKIYIYKMNSSKKRLPFNNKFAYNISKDIDLHSMESALKWFEGRKSFKAFTNNNGEDKSDFTRTIYSLTMDKYIDGISLIFKGSGFLYKMVRIITGTLIDIGNKKISPDAVPEILKSETRSNAGSTAPACGLILSKVNY